MRHLLGWRVMGKKVTTVFIKREKSGNVKKIRPATPGNGFSDVIFGFEATSCKQAQNFCDLW